MPLGATIAAAATPPGESALALVRASGPLAPAIAGEILGHGKERPAPRQAVFGDYHAAGGEVLDQVVVTRYAANSSPTGEDVLEISCHGNPLIVRRILEDLFARGCRPAEPGEFTRTAFVNGKLDLSQAEAVADLIRARSDAALRAAQRQLDGAMSRKVQEFSDQLLQVMAEIEAYIDFPEEDLPAENSAGPLPRLRELSSAMRKLLGTARYGTLLREGAQVVIAGPPNAGKSSLLNALLGRPRAIVSPEPGTTRDFLEERMLAGPYSIQITDTAGLREEAADTVEREGIARALDKVRTADLLLLIIDSSLQAPLLPKGLSEALSPLNTLVIENKTDLSSSPSICSFLTDYEHLRLSLKTGDGLEALQQKLTDFLEKSYNAPNDELALTSPRQVVALAQAEKTVSEAARKISDRAAAELVASDLRQALEALGEITGKADNEDVLDRLFKTFCIGK